jgi:hypothetical protein
MKFGLILAITAVLCTVVNGLMVGSVQPSICHGISDFHQCMETIEGTESCAWCIDNGSSVGTCMTQTVAEGLSSAQNECTFHFSYFGGDYKK